MSKSKLINLDNHFSITSANEISKIAAPLIQTFDVKHFRYLKLYPDGSRIVLSNYTDCTRFFYEEGNYKNMWFDGEYPENLNDGWYIWDVLRTINTGGVISPFEKEINQILDLYHGITFVSKSFNYYEIYTFDSNNSAIYHVDRQLLLRFIFYFKEQSMRLIDDAEKEKISLPSRNEFIQSEDWSHKTEIRDFLNKTNINRYYLQGKYSNIYLTAKEVQCLYWLLRGKSADEIAVIQGNSRKTIECHFAQIKNKLNCYKQTQLFQVLLESKILSSILLHDI